MRVIVTGSRGFFGSQLVEQLNKSGEHSVRAVDAEVDLRDGRAISALLRHFLPDIVVHLGGISGPMVAADDPPLVTAVNNIGIVNVLAAAAALRPIPRVIFASSVAALEDPPGSVYASTKIFAEAAAAYYRTQGVESVGLRIGSLYGAGRRTQHVVSNMARSARERGQVEFIEDAIEPLVHVKDAVQLTAGLLSIDHLASTYILVQDNVSHARLAKIVAEQFGGDVSVVPRAGSPLVWRQPLDGRAIVQATGIGYEITVVRGVTEVLHNMK